MNLEEAIQEIADEVAKRDLAEAVRFRSHQVRGGSVEDYDHTTTSEIVKAVLLEKLGFDETDTGRCGICQGKCNRPHLAKCSECNSCMGPAHSVSCITCSLRAQIKNRG